LRIIENSITEFQTINTHCTWAHFTGCGFSKAYSLRWDYSVDTECPNIAGVCIRKDNIRVAWFKAVRVI
jgi:hypothetical protein